MMKAVSIHQPFASAVALGAKRIETRSWPTKHRGPIAIHAAKHWTSDVSIATISSWTWCGVLEPYGVRMGGKVELETVLAFGAIIAVANLVDCRPTESFTVGELDTRRFPDGESADSWLSWTERNLGDFSLGRYGWVFDDIRPMDTPILTRGMQRIWNLSPAMEAEVRHQLPFR